jgi:hypothetical protein
MDIIICSGLEPVKYDYGHKQIRLIPFVCDTLDEIPVLSEHVEFRWVSREKLSEIDFCGADIIVAQEYTDAFRPPAGDSEKRSEEVLREEFDDAQLQLMINSMMSMKEVEWVANSAFENRVIFLKLLEYSYSTDRKLAFRASWTLTKVCDMYPEIISPHLPEIVEALPRLDNESVIRSFLRILSFAQPSGIPEKHRGILADYCFAALSSPETAIAVKAYSMEILYRLSLIYPQLANELAVSVRLLMEDGSAGIVSRGNAILKKITGIPLDQESSQT